MANNVLEYFVFSFHSLFMFETSYISFSSSAINKRNIFTKVFHIFLNK